MTRLRTTAAIYESMRLIPPLHPVLTPVLEVVRPEFIRNATPAEWDAKMRANWGDDWENME